MDKSAKLNFLREIDDSIDWTIIPKAPELSLPNSKSKSKKSRKRKRPTDTNIARNIPTVVFDNPDKKVETVPKLGKQFAKRTNNDFEIDLKKARWEVMKFGMGKLAGGEKMQKEVELAISLGAVKEKRVAINYKELVEQKKKQSKIEVVDKKPKLKKVMPKKKSYKNTKKR